MWIPEILIRHRIMGKNRIEPCKCGHFHKGKEVILPEVTPIAYMDMLVAKTKADERAQYILSCGIKKISGREVMAKDPEFWVEK